MDFKDYAAEEKKRLIDERDVIERKLNALDSAIRAYEGSVAPAPAARKAAPAKKARRRRRSSRRQEIVRIIGASGGDGIGRAGIIGALDVKGKQVGGAIRQQYLVGLEKGRRSSSTRTASTSEPDQAGYPFAEVCLALAKQALSAGRPACENTVTSGNSSVVEHNLAKVGVAGSSPVSRSNSSTELCRQILSKKQSPGRIRHPITPKRHEHETTRTGEAGCRHRCAFRIARQLRRSDDPSRPAGGSRECDGGRDGRGHHRIQARQRTQGPSFPRPEQAADHRQYHLPGWLASTRAMARQGWRTCWSTSSSRERQNILISPVS